MSEQHQFQAETSRLLDIVANALYTEREIFLRELISNAADACDRLRYEAIARPELAAEDTDYKISVTFDAAARTLSISDNGIGMSRDELVKNLGTIAHSGTRELMKSGADPAPLKSGADPAPSKKGPSLIGQFGVGFYSAFMVAEKVEVLSKKAGEDKAHVWTSDGKGAFTIDEALKDAGPASSKTSRGTEITLHLKDDAGEFLLEDRLKHVIRKYSDHIGFPITLQGVTVNTGAALWTRPKSEVTEDQYKEFYRSVSGALQFDEPWMTLHWKAEGAFEYTNLLFIPAMKPFDLYDPRRHHGVKLYVRRVFITDGVESLIPPFLRFMKGVVDSEDLPLNISRETLQASPVVAKMGHAITRKILSALEEKAKDDPRAYADFWALFGPVVKEGLYDAHAHRDQILRVCRFHSSSGPDLVSLEDYVSRMKEGQEHIHYLSAPSVEAARNSPQLEAFRAKGVEVLFLTDAIDEFWLPIQSDYKGRKFKSVTRGDAGLDKVKSETPAPEKAEEKPETPEKLIARLKEVLAPEVKDVTISTRLVDSPVCLVAPENDVDINMQRLLKKQRAYEDGTFQHILEINPGHPVIRRLQALAANEQGGEAFTDAALLLLDQARIVEGEPLKDPAAFARRMSKAIEKGLLAG